MRHRLTTRNVSLVPYVVARRKASARGELAHESHESHLTSCRGDAAISQGPRARSPATILQTLHTCLYFRSMQSNAKRATNTHTHAWTLGFPGCYRPRSAAAASRDARAVNMADAACALGAWLILLLSTVASFETCTAVGSLWPQDRVRSIRLIVLGTVALSGWAVATALLVFVFKLVLVGDFKGESGEGALFLVLKMCRV